MNTTGMVMTVTDELLAELELCESCDCGLDMDRAEVRTVMSELRRLRAENAELAQSLAESRANDQAAMGWLTSLRWASGDRGERMLPDLVAHIEELAKDTERYRWLRENDAREVSDGTCYDCQLYSGLELDAAIDAEMQADK